MRSKVQDATRQEKNDRWLDRSGVTRKHEAGKGTAREGQGQAVPQRDGEKSSTERGRAAAERRGSRTETENEEWGAGRRCKKKNLQHDRGKKNRGRDPDEER